MPIKHILLCLLVVVIWGINFIFVKLGLNEFSPLFLCSLRFLLASIPAVFFIKPPAMPFKMVVLYGLIMFALQFSFLFMGMSLGMTAGMASLIMQVQVFFSMFFATIFIGEKPTLPQVVGSLVSFSGIGLVAFHFDESVSLLGFLFILLSAATWGIGNLITKKIPNIRMISLVVWGCFIASIPMMALTFVFEGPVSMVSSYHQMTWVGGLSLLYIVGASTWIGYGIWGWLIVHYPIGYVVPFTLLVPVVGILGSIFMFGEQLQSWKLMSGLLVMSGLYINLAGSRWFKVKTAEAAAI